MIELSRFRRPQRRLVLLLWLALLLPLAQSAATLHGYSHLGQLAGSHEGKKQLAHEGPCELCLAAAALTGGALLDSSTAAPLPVLHDTLPRAVVADTLPARATPAYRSRAPPRA